jgi:hypothetical protein
MLAGKYSTVNIVAFEEIIKKETIYPKTVMLDVMKAEHIF